jgi:glutamine synthetase
MTTREILQAVKSHPANRVKIAYSDIDGILRGKYLSKEKFLSIAQGSTGFCDVIFGWDMADQAYDKGRYTGWHTGYPDAPARIDLSTYRTIPWEENIPFFLGELMDANGKPAAICPRQLLKKISGNAEKMGYAVRGAMEFEWYNFRETPQSLEAKNYQNPEPLTPGMFGYSVLRTTNSQPFFKAIFENLHAFAVPLEGLHTETGPGTFEAAIGVADLMEAADRAILFKTAVKEIAYQQGIMASFMAKVNEQLPGCGGHIHQSLWDKGGKLNLFTESKNKEKISNLMRQYIAGQLHCLPHILPMYAPTINSYKRLVEGAWAPTTLTWGFDNRTVALRVINSGGTATRIESRVPGADVNPYLAMAASVASGLYGIKHKLKLQQAATTGNGYRDESNGLLPRTLQEATDKMKASPIAKELFGDIFTEHFIMTREWEWRQHLKAVTDWEYRRYFEII